MQIPTPTSAADAAQLLADLAVTPRLVPNPPAQDGDTPLQTLTRRYPQDLGARFVERQQAWLRQEAQGSQVDLALPPVLWGWAYQEGVRRFLGNPGIRPDHLAPQVALSAVRRRVSVLDPITGVSPCPEGSWALCVTALTAWQVADDLDRWAPTLAASEGRVARDESASYRQHAAAAEAQLLASFGWLEGVRIPRAAEAQPTVAVQVRLGTT